jgi:hypothetical protein
MPMKSKSQSRMAYATMGGAKTGMPKTVAKEYIEATPKSAYGTMPERVSRKAAMKRKTR